MRIILTALLVCFLAPASVTFAQTPSPEIVESAVANPLVGDNERLYDGMKKIVRGAAEIMPEENYGFKPTDSVRSFGQIVGHVADSQYLFCSSVLSEENPRPGVEKSSTSKAGLIAALDLAFTYCERAYATLTDASAAEMVKFMGRDNPKLGVLTVNQVHTIEHYGNLVTYLRMNDLVPPTSDPQFMQGLQKR